MTRGRPEYEILEHTADIGVVVRAPDERQLFERCAAAMFDVMTDIDPIARGLASGAIVDEIDVDAPDRDALLVAWLGELLGRAMVSGVIYAAFAVVEAGPTHLKGRAWGKPLDPAQQSYRTEVKAVTYHQLLISEDRDGWSARVVFDI